MTTQLIISRRTALSMTMALGGLAIVSPLRTLLAAEPLRTRTPEAPAWVANAQSQTKDIEAIKQIERDWREAWNRHDMKALAALVAEDVDFVTVGGKWLKGRKAFEEHHASVHAMQFKESVSTTTDVQVKFLKPDIALVHVSWGMKGDKDADGTPRQPRSGILTQVVTKHGGRWLIQASHNTNIRETQPAK